MTNIENKQNLILERIYLLPQMINELAKKYRNRVSEVATEINCLRAYISCGASAPLLIIDIPEKDILKSMFVDAALSHSWCMEEHYPTEGAFEAVVAI